MADVSESLEYRFEQKGLRKLRRDMQKLAGDVEELGDEALRAGEALITAMEAGEDSVEDLDRALDGIDTKRARVAMQRLSDKFEGIEDQIDRLDGRTIDINTDVDEDRIRGDGRRGGSFRLPGELDEVQEGFEAFRMLPPHIQALGAAAVAATGALAGGAGLAVVATQLAAEFGPQGLQRDVQALTATYKETAREFSTAFEEVIRGEILPAGRGFAKLLRAASDDLATFSQFSIDVLKNVPGGLGAMVRGFVTAGQGGGMSTGDALVQGVGDLSGIRDVVSTMTDEIDNVRERFERGLIPREEMLSQIEGFRMSAFQELQKLQDKFPNAFPEALLDRFAQQLRTVQKRLEVLTSEIPTDQFQRLQNTMDLIFGGVGFRSMRATPAGGDVSGPQPADGSTFRPGSTSVGGLQAQARMLQRVREQLTAGFTTTQRVGVRMVSRIGAGLGDVLGRMATLQTRVQSLGDVFVSVGRAIVQSLQRVVSQLIRAVTQATILKGIMSLFGIGSLGSLGGSFGSIFSGLLGLDSGGFVKRDGLAMLHAGEVVAPIDRVESMIQPAAQPATGSFEATWDIGLDRLRLELERNQSFKNA
jgi:predicted nuclease with TOPRIM domain